MQNCGNLFGKGEIPCRSWDLAALHHRLKEQVRWVSELGGRGRAWVTAAIQLRGSFLRAEQAGARALCRNNNYAPLSYLPLSHPTPNWIEAPLWTGEHSVNQPELTDGRFFALIIHNPANGSLPTSYMNIINGSNAQTSSPTYNSQTTKAHILSRLDETGAHMRTHTRHPF